MSIRIQAYRNSAAIFALGAMALTATPAFAEKAGLNSMSFDAKDASGAIHVISTDKAKWNQIKPGAIQFNARMKINTKYPGYVDDVAVLLGECDGGFCAGVLPVLWSDSIVERDYDSTEAVGLPTLEDRRLRHGHHAGRPDHRAMQRKICSPTDRPSRTASPTTCRWPSSPTRARPGATSTTSPTRRNWEAGRTARTKPIMCGPTLCPSR